ncbi:MAG: CRISPR system precrRNA processing endoribonuclease RAMP protein Cas6 [Gammaproteobacteria bacterium]|nr:CRISPR system precrRNA processing endoribonuclease RAMP protein Cas6 [Gammaproteobacteria bacterium]
MDSPRQSVTVTQDQAAPVPRLAVGAYRLTFATPESFNRSVFLGSAWRGAFGHALKQTVCVTRMRECVDCMLYRVCTYPYVFETPPPADTRKMRRYAAAPHPFVLVLPPSGLHASEEGSFLGLHLFGRGNDLLPFVLLALQRAGERGVGAKRVPFRLRHVEQSNAAAADQWTSVFRPGGALQPIAAMEPICPPVPARVRVILRTPLRMKRDERLVGPSDFRFADLFGALLRRISMLTYFHGNFALETDFQGLSEAADLLNAEQADLRWHDWTRYSSRQQTAMQMGGLVGTIDLAGAALAPFWPYLWLGQWTHAGKAASMGLGCYQLEVPASLPEPESAPD